MSPRQPPRQSPALKRRAAVDRLPVAVALLAILPASAFAHKQWLLPSSTSVTGKDVADVLKKAHQIDIDKRKISIKNEVTGVGTYDAIIKVHPEITSTIKVHVVAG